MLMVVSIDTRIYFCSPRSSGFPRTQRICIQDTRQLD
jgi:hypothetical protein